jgi:transcriptional regulator with PAS, ATPase and Fis domain
VGSYSEETIDGAPRLTPERGLRLADIERRAIERALRVTGNNRSAAARLLGITRPTLLRKINAYSVVLPPPVTDD